MLADVNILGFVDHRVSVINTILCMVVWKAAVDNSQQMEGCCVPIKLNLQKIGLLAIISQPLG